MVDKDEKKPLAYAAPAAGYIGRMYLRGEGVRQDFKTAKAWFDRGAEAGDRECHNGLGIIYRDGLGIKQDMKKALAHFSAAAGQELAEAQVNIGKYHFGITSNGLSFIASHLHPFLQTAQNSHLQRHTLTQLCVVAPLLKPTTIWAKYMPRKLPIRTFPAILPLAHAPWQCHSISLWQNEVCGMKTYSGTPKQHG